jgi:uncharacterized protein YcnI
MKKYLLSLFIGFSVFLFFSAPAFAHVIVTPNKVGIAEIQDFTVSVPNERDNPVVSVKLLIPKGVMEVVPDGASGWTITTKSSGSGDQQTVSEIDWDGGSIPVGQREEFIFQAQAPATPTTVFWKAYQTYSDGTIVSWDVDPKTLDNLSDAQQDALADKENKGEYSTTQVINDLAASNMMAASQNEAAQNAQMAELLAGFAVLLAIVAIFIALKKNK